MDIGECKGRWVWLEYNEEKDWKQITQNLIGLVKSAYSKSSEKALTFFSGEQHYQIFMFYNISMYMYKCLLVCA